DEEAHNAQSETDLQQKLEDSKGRLEMAVQDVRELKTRNADLQEQLAEAKSNQSSASEAAAGESLDWEAQKRKLLASLENDFDDEEEDDQQERLTINGTISITDRVVAEKDSEIEDLKKLLEEQASQVGDMAVGAAAVAELLDHDDLVCEERSRLEGIQKEWKEKLRKAEIDISLERAKLARERVELDGRIRKLEAEQAEGQSAPEQGKTARRSGGRWLARLGLKDSDDES
ncbi:unnamed protein product, partial [marine sediment metagenome]